MKTTRLLLVATLALAVALGACEDDGGRNPLVVESTGTVSGVLFEDRDRNGQAGGGDRGVEGWSVTLRQSGGGTHGTAVTDTAGRFTFSEVPIGGAVLEVDENLLGDTLELFGVALEPFILGADEVRQLQPGVRLLTYELAEVRTLAPGLPLFTSGIALNSLNSAVRTLHIKTDDGDYLRVGGILSNGLQPGDSVRVRGRTAREAGQPFLQEGAFFLLRATGVIPEPVDVTTFEADGAVSGSLDAALVQIDTAEILTAELLDNDDVRVVVDDGSGPVEILMRAFLGMDEEDFVADTIFFTRARGLLVPYEDAGDTRWRLLPRVRSDFRIEERDFPPPPPPSPPRATSVEFVQRNGAARAACRRSPKC